MNVDELKELFHFATQHRVKLILNRKGMVLGSVSNPNRLIPWAIIKCKDLDSFKFIVLGYSTVCRDYSTDKKIEWTPGKWS